MQKHLIYSSSVLLILLFFIVGCGNKALQLKRQGDQAYMSSNLSGAISSYKQSLALNPMAPYANLQHGAVLVDMKRFDEAKPYLLKADKLLPNNFLVKYDIARMYLGQDEIDLAIKYLTECMRLNASFPLAYNAMGIANLKNMEQEKALEWFNKALKIDPNFGEANYNIAVTYFAQEKFIKAAQQFQEVANRWQALKLDALHDVIVCYRKLKRKAERAKNTNLINKYIRLSQDATKKFIAAGGSIADMK